MSRIRDGRSGSSRTSSPMRRFGKGTVAFSTAILALALTAQVMAQQAETPAAGAAGSNNANPSPAMPEAGSRAEGAPLRLNVSLGMSRLLDSEQPLTRVAISQPEVAEAQLLSPRQVMVVGRALGTTQLITWDKNDSQRVYDVVVEPDLRQLREAIARMAPSAKVDIQVMRDHIVLVGRVPDVDTSERIADLARVLVPNVHNHLKVAGEYQVLLRCTVAEVTKSAIRRLGINGWLAGDNVRDVFAVNQLDGINPVNIGAGPTGNIIQPKIGAGFPPESLLFATDEDGLPLLPPPQGPEFSLGFPRVQMQLFFRAMRENGLLKILAEPNVTAMSGQEAKFLAGGEFPVPIPQGLGTTTIEWREFGVRLRFQPTVIGRQMIRLRVAPEVSERDFTQAVVLQGGTTVPGLTARSVETTVEVASGSTIALAGLLNEQARAFARSLPGIGEVPVLGALFRSVDYQRNLTELVILVTPELVTSMNPDQVGSVPGQFVTEPNDWQLYGLGMVEGEPAEDTSTVAESLEHNLPVRYRKASSPPDQMPMHGPFGHEETVTVQ